LLGCRWQIELGDEALHQFARHRLPARESLELFVRFGQAMPAHHGLHCFGQQLPGAVEVSGERRVVNLQPLQQ